MSLPRATMRLQFHKGFTFDDAIAVVPYLASLGISHLYASPIMTARAGSLHGYDVVDPTVISPELGGEAGFRRLVAALREAGLGIIIDIVPNHLAVGADNRWWLDVLQHGRQSAYAHFFDIDWEPDDPALKDKVLLPVLGRPYGDALREGEIQLVFNESFDRYEAHYFQHVFPIDPLHRHDIEQYPLESFDAANFGGRVRLQALLEQQHFRLAWWRSANDAINWRRFFDINELAALRVEDDDVFEKTHATILRLFAEKLIDGVRIDHIDGLADPKAYCQRLRALFDMLRTGEGDADHPYIIVEKILGADEELPDDWGCDGTSGCDFMVQVSRLQHEPRSRDLLVRWWASLSGRSADFAVEEDISRRESLERSFASQLEAAVTALHRLAQQDLATRDLARPALRRTLIEILAHMRVYRSYASPRGGSPADKQHLSEAVTAAMRSCLPQDRVVLEQLAGWLGGEVRVGGEPIFHREAIRRFQQLSAPLAAKSVADTAFYRYAPLLSRNDVGFDPSHFGDGIVAFHKQSAERAAHFPHAMLATATHDHKRGEDVRARLAVLSEIPDEWARIQSEWLNEAEPLFADIDGARAPSFADASLLFQTLVGAWPLHLAANDPQGLRVFADRVAEWQLKALREAKLATDWTVPNEAYKSAAHAFLMQLFVQDWPAKIAGFVQRIAAAGAANGLAQTLLKLTSPGVPDIYQGTDYWDFSLVDPDNRRPVDFAGRMKVLGAGKGVAALASNWRSGAIKQALIRDALAARRAHLDLFARGSYVPLSLDDAMAEHVVAFARQYEGAAAVVVASRLTLQLADGALSVPPARWGTSALSLPASLSNLRFHNVLLDRPAVIENARAPLAKLLDGCPVALLIGVPG